MQPQYTLLPEWSEQEAVILAWPHAQTDWANNLRAVQDTYIDIIWTLSTCDASILLLCPEHELENLQATLPEELPVLIVVCDYNDTWCRDYCFLSVQYDGEMHPLSFQFNGWGGKYESALDNKVSKRLASLCNNRMLVAPQVVEGGALEIDENQHLLSTESCLLHQGRNPDFTISNYEQLFADTLGARKVSVLENGLLQGDDTDGHIDTLARFTPLMGVVVQGAQNRPNDVHFASLYKMEQEISSLLPKHKIYSLPLPYVENNDGERLPASYANFLIVNRHVLVPTYQVAEDDTAIAIIEKAFPNYSVVGIDCASLVQQYGSLHCITMQVPQNTLKEEILEQARRGVSVL